MVLAPDPGALSENLMLSYTNINICNKPIQNTYQSPPMFCMRYRSTSMKRAS
ncbi:hypothetical protein KFK09_022769 [Dendrobium nobile]|uniref:Uncharacterized protein n=1 Tax=Dendrobium nobile TaxID=94219 RepID=A0A8T3AKV3_DENNO|nr:hypothetical protein KFK09_022769 [Dendrobium nobile]